MDSYDSASLLHGMLGRNAFDDLGSGHVSVLAADLNRTGEDRRAKVAFGYLTEPRNRNVSAVLYKPDFGLWSMGKSDWLLLHNPFVLKGYHLPTGLFPFAHEISFDAKYRAHIASTNQTALGILGLPEAWPYSAECECTPYSRADIDNAVARIFNQLTEGPA